MRNQTGSTLSRGLACSLFLLALVSQGCPLRRHAVAEPPAAPSAGTVKKGRPPAPPPTEAELAIRAAEDAESHEDYSRALDLYDWASTAQNDRAVETDIDYRVARLRADPESGQSDLAAARRGFEKVLANAPEHPRAREARLILNLLDALDRERSRGKELAARLEALLADQARLKAQLEKKEQELHTIKEVLLQKKP
ncbi:MAG: hypothetical protein ACE5HU_01310 [Acidobacteriota bacterium]